MPDAVLAIDAGTTSVRALVVDSDGSILGRARSGYALDYPAPGWVEQNPEQLWTATQGVVESALTEAGLKPSDLCAAGIAAQRSSCIVWERTTGKALSPLVSWQDLRGTQRALELQQQGYLVLPQSVASKLEMVLETIGDGRDRMARGELVWGNVDSFLASRLSGGEAHITDPSHACTTGYYDLTTGGWHAGMLELQGLDPACFPRIVDSNGPLGKTAKSVFGAEVTLGAIIGDQQSAAIAQGCRKPGDGKITYGTSGSFDVHTGSRVLGVQGTYPLVLIRQKGETSYCVEGMVITAGAVFDWLADGLGALDDPAQAAAVAASVEDTHGVFMLPALQGLGAPHLHGGHRLSRARDARPHLRGLGPAAACWARGRRRSFRQRPLHAGSSRCSRPARGTHGAHRSHCLRRRRSRRPGRGGVGSRRRRPASKDRPDLRADLVRRRRGGAVRQLAKSVRSRRVRNPASNSGS
jgi:glycerol kinase